jgi:hypothetical protein
MRKAHYSCKIFWQKDTSYSHNAIENKLNPGKATIQFIIFYFSMSGPSLWSSGQSSWLLTQRSRVRFPALPDFLGGGGPGTGSTQPL